MNPGAADQLRRSAAHVLVDDIDVPVLDERADHHVHRVLRVRDGEVVSVTDGAGRWRLCRSVGGAIVPETEIEVEPLGDPVTVGFAVPKQDRPEWIVQKLTELGVGRIVVLQADRSVVRWDGQRADKHLDKLRRRRRRSSRGESGSPSSTAPSLRTNCCRRRPSPSRVVERSSPPTGPSPLVRRVVGANASWQWPDRESPSVTPSSGSKLRP